MSCAATHASHGRLGCWLEPGGERGHPNQTIRNPMPQGDIDSSVNTNSELMSQAVYPVGDIGGNCTASDRQSAQCAGAVSNRELVREAPQALID